MAVAFRLALHVGQMFSGAKAIDLLTFDLDYSEVGVCLTSINETPDGRDEFIVSDEKEAYYVILGNSNGSERLINPDEAYDTIGLERIKPVSIDCEDDVDKMYESGYKLLTFAQAHLS